MLASTISAPVWRSIAGVIALTVAAVPTGMKAGVSTVPWALCRRPRRAAPSLASSSKRNAGALTAAAPAERRGDAAHRRDEQRAAPGEREVAQEIGGVE